METAKLTETPPNAHKIGLAYQYGDTKTGRHAVIEDIGSVVPEVLVSDFLNCLLPPLDNINVPGVVDALRREGHIKENEEGEFCWALFLDSPSCIDGLEDKCFKPLEDLSKEIFKQSGIKKEQTFIYTQNPRQTPQPVNRDSASRPDGYFVKKVQLPGDKVHWMDVGLSAEYKKVDNDDNRTDVSFRIFASLVATE